ncbi:MAG: hypothetical protein P8I59_09125, partial [Pseudomonadales bacterium]|nr:hypothetical protein [Pseudomonadales bacterium]
QRLLSPFCSARCRYKARDKTAVQNRSITEGHPLDGIIEAVLLTETCRSRAASYDACGGGG